MHCICTHHKHLQPQTLLSQHLGETSTKKGSYLNSKLEASLGHIERLHLKGKLISSDDGLLGPFLCYIQLTIEYTLYTPPP